MEYITKNMNFSLSGESVVTLGKFDGLHRGHKKLLSRVIEISQQGFHSVVFTFDVSPLVKLSNNVSKNILDNVERKELLEAYQIDYLIEYPFVDEVVHMEAEQFVQKILVEQLHAACVVVGPDFCFGYNRRGNVKLLQQLGPRYGFTVEVMEKEKEAHREISSTFIREELQKGNLTLVNKLLGYPFFVLGEVVHGKQLGRTMGLPTINQIPSEGKLLPPRGVYVSETQIDGELFKGITNIGCKPTVDGAFVGVETYLFDCNEDLYGKIAKVQLYEFQRIERKFASVEELKQQIKNDEIEGKRFFLNREEI